MSKIYSVAFSLLIFSPATAQYSETISSDRPGQALTSFTVGKGILQAQSGFDHFGMNDSPRGTNTKGFLNNTVLRYGIAEVFEVNSQFEYKIQSTEKNNNMTIQAGLSAIDIGMRYHVYTGKGQAHSVALQGGIRLPILGGDYQINHIAPRFSVITNQKISKTFRFNTVWGVSWNGLDNSVRSNYVIHLSSQLSNSLGVFIENYGSIENGIFLSNIDGGLAWLITNNLQIGLYGGYGGNHEVSNYFLSTGLSWRSKRKN
jgi:hypothetical protein